jgi:hypothetical protein
MERQAVETVPAAPSAEATDMGGLTNSKEIPAQLDREFPIDEAVIEGGDQLTTQQCTTYTYFDRSFAPRSHISLCGEVR